MRQFRIISLVLLAAFLMSGQQARCQFKKDAFQQNYNPKDTTHVNDSVEKLFDVKEYIGALKHKNTMKIGTMAGGSAICIGGCQIYNKQYWKLPIVYGSIGTCATIGGINLGRYNASRSALEAFETERDAWLADNPGMEYPHEAPEVDSGAGTRAKWWLIGAGVCYWATLMDGVINFKDGREPHPGRATLYSILLPGLGQIYNKEYWKLPIYYGGLVLAAHFWSVNETNYQRYRRIYIEASADPSCPISAENAKYYRDFYRRYRDYSILATAAVYLLQVIDANVFAHMGNFEVDDDISLRVSPALIPNDNAYAMSSPASFGMRLGLNF